MIHETEQMTEQFFSENQCLQPQKDAILQACRLLIRSFQNGNKLLLCGNGGSCADCEHIVGELMKGFLKKRPLAKELKEIFAQRFGSEGVAISNKLQGALPAISLTGHGALSTAFSNDVDPSLIFAQQLMGYGNTGDVLFGISTSGNAQNIIQAVRTAQVKQIKTIILTGKSGGELKDLCDIAICAPEDETYRIQEQHIRIYHFICSYVEATFFSS